MDRCGICKLPKHSGACLPVALRRIGELEALLDKASNAEQELRVSLELVSNNNKAPFDKKAYQRDLMRDRRAAEKAAREGKA